MHTTNESDDLKHSIELLDSVYGSVDSPEFPKPMPSTEAGPCADGRQHRYLWTDAFGVLAYVSIADHFGSKGNCTHAMKYREAANTLVDVVHQCLGVPRSAKIVDAMTLDSSSPTGYVGLRIGKVFSKKETDFGMSYDGMYFHYIDKWLLALARSGHIEDGIRIAKSCFPYFFDDNAGDGRGGGIRWKLSPDASPPRNYNRASPNDDTLVALITLSILEAHRTDITSKLSSEEEKRNYNISLDAEIKYLENALEGYVPRVTHDPLGWGLEVMYDQFLDGHPRQRALASLQSIALDQSNISLPFRLYGAMIGARLAGRDVVPERTVKQLIDMSIAHEKKAMETLSNEEDHSCINRVMLAMCMLSGKGKGALARKTGDPLITLQKRE